MPMPHWEWNTTSAPPGSRVSALAPEAELEEAQPNMPELDAAIGFEEHVKTYFHKRERQSMLFAFDLWANATSSRTRRRSSASCGPGRCRVTGRRRAGVWSVLGLGRDRDV